MKMKAIMKVKILMCSSVGEGADKVNMKVLVMQLMNVNVITNVEVLMQVKVIISNATKAEKECDGRSPDKSCEGADT